MKNQVKSEMLKTRVTPEDKAKIEYKALSSYRTISHYLRDVALDKPIIAVEGMDTVADQLRRIGNNLNQITRLANANMIRVVDLQETRKELNAVWQLLNSLPRTVR